MTDKIQPERKKQIILIGGKSGTGKSSCLQGLRYPENVLYLNCEPKELPFPSEFRQINITDPLQVYTHFDNAEQSKSLHTIVIDTGSFMMEMFESQHVNTAANKMAAWGDYGNFFKTLMHVYVAKSTKDVIFLWHTADRDNEAEGTTETLATVKGALKNTSLEAFFTTVAACKKVPLTRLEPYQNDLLNIDEDDHVVGYKHVIQTRITKSTVNEGLKANRQLWKVSETFIDGNIQHVMDRLHTFYNGSPRP